MKGFQRGDPRATEAGRKGGTVGGYRRWRRVLLTIQALWPDMPKDAATAIWQYGETRYRSGHKAGKRA